MSDYTPKLGDRVRVTVEGWVRNAWPHHYEVWWDETCAGGYRTVSLPRDYSPDDLVSVERIPDPEPQWQRGDVVRDDSGNLFAFHPIHGWCGLGSNQMSARGWFTQISGGHPYRPLTLLVRDGQAAQS